MFCRVTYRSRKVAMKPLASEEWIITLPVNKDGKTHSTQAETSLTRLILFSVSSVAHPFFSLTYIYIYISYVLSRHSAFILRAAYGQPALCPAFPECASRKSSTRSTRLLARFQVSRPYVPRLWRDSLVHCASLRLLSESWFLTSWCAQKENLRIVANFSLIPTEPKRSPQWAPEKNCIAMFRQRQRL